MPNLLSELAKRSYSKPPEWMLSCAEHGFYTSFFIRSKWSICTVCQLKKDWQNEQYEIAEWQKESARRELEKRLGQAAIPDRFMESTFENYLISNEGQEMALAKAKSYADHFDAAMSLGSSLIMRGGLGTGKTHLASAIAHHVMSKGKTAIFSGLIGILNVVKQTYSKDAETSESEAINAYILPDLLIIDEVGVQRFTEAEMVIIYQIINGRYEKKKPVVLTTNCDICNLELAIGERCLDRLRDGGKMIEFDWGSNRDRRTKEK